MTSGRNDNQLRWSSFSVPGTLGHALQAFFFNLEMEEEEDATGRRKFQATPYP